MIELGDGNLLASETEALVNTVNTVGVMGKGVALQFKQAFPDNYASYRNACKSGRVKLGEMYLFDNGHLGSRRYIINFPTKDHWRSKSRIADIESGLDDLVRVLAEHGIESVAVPALGCGNGGLSWSDVEPIIESKLSSIPTRCVIFPPVGAPEAREMLVATKRPTMTYGRAALLALVGRYAYAAMRDRFELIRPGASLLEIQKLMYLLQEAGQPLKLNYVKGRYGPYAENLNKVLEALEGHHIRGYGDRSRAVLELDPIEVYEDSLAEADNWMVDNPRVKDDVERVLASVAGWENAYGLELLGTVLYATRAEAGARESQTDAVNYVHSWDRRKAATFPTEHVEAAWRHLNALNWL